MDIVEIYFAFHRPATLKEIWSGKASLRSIFGHVEAFGYTIDDTWFFYDPSGTHSKLLITHLHDEVNTLLAERVERSREIFRMPHDPDYYRAPIHGPMNCVTQCAALIGWRAFTPRGFRKRLLKSNAEMVHGIQHPKRRSPSQG